MPNFTWFSRGKGQGSEKQLGDEEAKKGWWRLIERMGVDRMNPGKRGKGVFEGARGAL